MYSSCGPGRVVGIAIGYGLDGPGIESRWGEIFRTCPDRSWGSFSMGTGSFPGVKSGRCVTLTTHPLLLPWSWKGRAIHLLPLCALRPVHRVSILHTVKSFQSFCIQSLFNDRISVSILAGTMCQSSGIAVQWTLINEGSINRWNKNVLLWAQTYFLTDLHTYGTYKSCLTKKERNKQTYWSKRKNPGSFLNNKRALESKRLILEEELDSVATTLRYSSHESFSRLVYETECARFDVSLPP